MRVEISLIFLANGLFSARAGSCPCDPAWADYSIIVVLTSWTAYGKGSKKLGPDRLFAQWADTKRRPISSDKGLLQDVLRVSYHLVLSQRQFIESPVKPSTKE